MTDNPRIIPSGFPIIRRLRGFYGGPSELWEALRPLGFRQSYAATYQWEIRKQISAAGMLYIMRLCDESGAPYEAVDFCWDGKFPMTTKRIRRPGAGRKPAQQMERAE